MARNVSSQFAFQGTGHRVHRTRDAYCRIPLPPIYDHSYLIARAQCVTKGATAALAQSQDRRTSMARRYGLLFYVSLDHNTHAVIVALHRAMSDEHCIGVGCSLYAVAVPCDTYSSRTIRTVLIPMYNTIQVTVHHADARARRSHLFGDSLTPFRR